MAQLVREPRKGVVSRQVSTAQPEAIVDLGSHSGRERKN